MEHAQVKTMKVALGIGLSPIYGACVSGGDNATEYKCLDLSIQGS